MPVKHNLSTLLLFATLLLSSALTAEELPLYRVELILFSQTPVPGEDETWPPPQHHPLLAEAQVPETGSSTAPLDKTSASMNAILSTLKRSALYQPLFHSVWIQPGWPAAEARAVRIEIPRDAALPVEIFSDKPPIMTHSTARPAWQLLPGFTSEPVVDDLLYGTLTISLARYLHADFDLMYRKKNTGETAVPQEAFDPLLGPPPQQSTYIDIPLRQKRRMRSREIHYIDHPLLGALIEITPVEPDPAVEPTPPTPAVDNTPEPN